MRVLVAFALAAILFSLIAAAQLNGPRILLTPIATSLNLTAGEVAPLTFVLQNLGEEDAVNVTLSLAASGCAQLLNWNGTWEIGLVVNVGDLAPSSVKRVVVPVRCQAGSGSITATAYGDNADPTYAVIKVSAKESGEPWLLASIPLVAAATLGSAYAVRRARRKSWKPRSAKHGKASQKRFSRSK